MKCNLQPSVDKANTEKEENKETARKEENKMEIIHSQVQTMIKEGKGVEECLKRKETLENILSILDPEGVGGEKEESEEIHKIDEQKTSNVTDSDLPRKPLELKGVVENLDDDLYNSKEATKPDSTDEFSSSDISMKNIQSDISKLIAEDLADSGAKGAKKSSKLAHVLN